MQTTEDDDAEASRLVVPLVVPSQRNRDAPKNVKTQKNPGKTGVLGSADGAGGGSKYTRRVLNGTSETRDDEPESAAVGHVVGQSENLIEDAQLLELVNLWQTLDETGRNDLLGVARGLARRE